MLLVVFLAVLLLLLLARCSHWAFHTQRKLDETNALLREMVAEARVKRGERGPPAVVPPAVPPPPHRAAF